MRQYVLTETERKILGTFIKDGVRLNGIVKLLWRIKTYKGVLQEDLNLMDEALKKVEELKK